MMPCESLPELLDALAQTRHLGYAQSHTLPAACYTSEAFFEHEMQQLFKRQWICLGRSEEIPKAGDFFTTEILNEPLLVVRGDDDNIRVLSNVCRHRAMPLAEGRGQSKQFLCPYHAWRYDTRGQLLNAPFVEARADWSPIECRLPEFPVSEWRGFLYTSLDPDVAPLAPALAGLEPLVENYHMQDMQLIYSDEQVWDTNWKCLLENFMEGYHLSTVHTRTLHPITPTRLCEHFPPGPGYMGYYSNFPADLPDRGHYPERLSPEERQRSVMFCNFPAHVAGTAGHLATYICLMPLSVGRVRAKLGMIATPGAMSEAQCDEAIDLFLRTMAEDKVQLLNVMRGLASSHYQPAPLAGKDYEGTLWDFYHYLARQLCPQQAQVLSA